MQTISFITLSLLLIQGIFIAPAHAADSSLKLLPYTANYSAEFNGMDIKATHELSLKDGQYQITTRAKNFLGSIEELETFRIDKGQIAVEEYQYERALLGSKRNEKLSVDHHQRVAHYTRKKKTREIALQSHYLGPLSYQLQIRRDLVNGAKIFNYEVMHRGRVKQYRFEIIGEETLETPAGSLNCLKLKRIRENSNRETLFWMAEDLDYLLVKLKQNEDNETHELNLSSYKLASTANGN